MRILAIRGKNLASLANDFEVLLEEGPLQQAGLFAITGATGAGKSTILDALCLALYDQMPRLPEGHGVAIGHKEEDDAVRVKSHDVSSILRRGTANAYAEVDFIGKDKHSYRARWEISRARNKVTGRLQAQKISLENLHSKEKIGQGKKDTQFAIIERIGLNFDQFRRSVLLAQGDFAAFLKAKKDERSSLLEKITGTDIYSELSIAAFDRAKEEKQHLEKIEAKLADKVPLDKESRNVLETEQAQLHQQLSNLLQAVKDKQTCIDWFMRQTDLTQEISAAQTIAQLSQEQWNNTASKRLLLEQVMQAQALRPLLEQEQALSKDLLVATATIDQNQQALLKAEQAVEEISIHVTKYSQVYSAAQRDQAEAQPLLIAARKLDAHLEDNHTRLNELGNKSKEQQAVWQAVNTKFEAFTINKEQQANTQQQLAIWQEQQSALAPLVNEWGRWENNLKELIALDHNLQQEQQQHVMLGNNITQKQAELSHLQAQDSLVLKQKNQLNVQLADIEKQADTHSLTNLHQQKSVLEVQQENIDNALNLATMGNAQQHSLSQDKDALILTKKTRQEATIQIEQLAILQTNKQSQLHEAQRSFNLMQAASQKTAQDLRDLLTEHTPCPVCGAEEHPWANLQASINQPLVEQQARLKSLEQNKEELITQLSEQHSLMQQAKKDSTRLEKNIAQAETIYIELSQQWQNIKLDNMPEWTSLKEADVTLLAQQSDTLKTNYATAKKLEAAALALQKQLTDLRSQKEALAQQEFAQTTKTAELDKKLAELHSTLSAQQTSIERLTDNIKSINTTLSTPFKLLDNWQDEVAQSGEDFLQKLRKTMGQWQKNVTQQSALKETLLQIDHDLAVIDSDATQQHKLWQKYKQEQEQQEKQYQRLLTERQRYFNGAPANNYALELEQQLQQAGQQKQQIETDLVTAEMDIKSCHAALEHWQEEQQRRLANKLAAAKKLITSLHTHGLNQERLAELLSKDGHWIKTQTQENQRVTTALQEAQATLKVKSENILKHEQQRPKEDEATVREHIQQYQTQHKNISQEHDNKLFALRSDDEKIISGKHLQQQLTEQKQRWEQWEGLNELIGSKNGQKFRIFAQSLTLETLLSYTNSHLQEFAKRYHLQRVPGSDLELQVIDRDMADEVRSVHSLSGGESFLVSLALALGLASLSSSQTQVESLFIDEGFGSLDPETLDIAIASLDTLQSLGRKVGVISHVPALVERIGAQVLVEKIGGGQSVVSVKAYA